MVKPLSVDSVVVAVRDQVSCDVGGEAIVLTLRDGVYYSLNSVGAKVWALIQERRTLGELRDAVLREYPEVESQRVESDVRLLVEQMEEWNVAEVVE